jgi:hypothetical protein
MSTDRQAEHRDVTPMSRAHLLPASRVRSAGIQAHRARSSMRARSSPCARRQSNCESVFRAGRRSAQSSFYSTLSARSHLCFKQSAKKVELVLLVGDPSSSSRRASSVAAPHGHRRILDRAARDAAAGVRPGDAIRLGAIVPASRGRTRRLGGLRGHLRRCPLGQFGAASR